MPMVNPSMEPPDPTIPIPLSQLQQLLQGVQEARAYSRALRVIYRLVLGPQEEPAVRAAILAVLETALEPEDQPQSGGSHGQ